MSWLRLVVLFAVGFQIFLSCNQEIDNEVQGSYLSSNEVAFTSLAYYNDNMVFCAKLNGDIFEYDNQGNLKRRLDIGHEIYDIATSSQLEILVVSSSDSAVRVIDVHSLTVQKVLKIGDVSLTVDFDTFSNSIVAAENNSGLIHFWNGVSFTKEKVLETNMKIFDIELFSGGDKILVGGYKTAIWDIQRETKVVEFRHHFKPVTSVDINKKENMFLSSSLDKRTFVYSLEDYKKLGELNHPSWIYEFQEKNVKLVDTIPISMAITRALFNDDRIYTSSADNSVRVWDANSFEVIQTLLGHEASVVDFGFDSSGSRLASVDLLGKIKYWSVLQ